MTQNKTHNIRAHAFSLGVCMTFDGLVFLNDLEGTFHLLHDPTRDFAIQVRYISCQRHFVCIDAVSIKHGQTVVAVLAARTEEENSMAYVNGTVMRSLSTGFDGHAGTTVSFTKMTPTLFSYVIPSTLVININTYPGHLDLSSKVLNATFCYNCSGLWGSCNNNSLNDLHDYNSSIWGRFGNTSMHRSTWSLSTVTQDYLRNVFLKSWQASKDKDLLVANGLNRTNGPFALRVNGTVLKTNELFSMVGSDTSMEIFVKVAKKGVVWTYSQRNVFGLILDKTVLIFQGDTTMDTGLSINLHTWYKICITYEAVTERLNVYAVEMSGLFELRTYTNAFSKDLFYPGGIFSVGGTYIPASGVVKVAAFVGDVFQIRLWNKTLSVDEIRTNVAVNIPCNSKDLASMWRFEQIQHGSFQDCAASVTLKVANNIAATRVSWVEAIFSNVYEKQSALTVFARTEKLNYLEQKCVGMISAFDSCIRKNQPIFKLFKTLCIRELWISGFFAIPWHTNSMISKFCSTLHQENATQHCKCLKRVRRDWSGVNVDKRCYFGKLDSSGNCVCVNGFYGQTCQIECPGGSGNSCYGQGNCNRIDGSCDCQINFATSSCNGCATNWTGSDCGVALGIRNRHRMAYSCQSSKRNLIGFSGAGLRINSYGEFYLIRTKEIRLQARYLPCANRTICLHAIGLNVENTNLTVYNPNITAKGENVVVNGNPVRITHARMISSRVQLIPLSTTMLKIVTHGAQQVNTTLTFLATDMFVTVTSNTCDAIDGLCGSCESYRRETKASEKVMEYTMRACKVENQSDSIFVYNKRPFFENRTTSDFVYMIYLNNSGISSEELLNVFRPTSDFTIEIFVKLFTRTGTLLSYFNIDTMGIVLSESLKIYYGHEVIDCKIKPKLNVWVRFVFAYDAKLSILSVYQFKSRYDYEVNRFILKRPLLEAKGHLQIGYWQATKSKPNAEQRAPFNGFVDELRIWDKNFGQFFLESLHRSEIPLRNRLKAYWKFNEAQGSTYYDETAGMKLRLPKSINSLDVWRFSDLLSFPLKQVINKPEIYNETLKLAINVRCKTLIYHKDLNERCGRFLGKALVDFFYLSCTEEGYGRKDTEAAYPTLLAYISYCKSVMNVDKWPRLALCDVVPSRYYGSIGAIGCVVPCKCMCEAVHTRCVFEHGYCRPDRSMLYPGGKINTCSGKGECNITTGTCECQENWKGNSNCSACTPGWTGNDCQIVATPEPPSSVCSLIPGGHLVTLNAIHTTFYGHGEFHMLGNEVDRSRIHVFQEPCLDDMSRCITGIAVKTDMHMIRIKATGKDQTEPKLTIDNKVTLMEKERIEFDDIAVTRSESSLYGITIANNTRNSLHLTVRNLGREFVITLRVTGRYCNMSTSLCSRCHESGGKLFDLPHSEIEDAVKVPRDQLALSKKFHETAKFRLRFKGVGVATNVLPSVYFSKDITIELRFTAKSASVLDSTLFSVSGSASFGLVVQRTLKLVIGREFYDTAYSIERDKVNHVTLVYSHALRQIRVFYINSLGNIRRRIIDLPTWLSFLEPMSTIVVSEWVSGFRDRSFYPATPFQGVIHEMRIWQHAYSHVDIEWLYKKKATKTDRGLLSLWKFDEGRGNVVRDLVSGINLYIPPVRTAPEWVRITVSRIPIPIGNDVKFPNAREKQRAISWCHVQIYSSPLYLACSALSRPSLR